MISETAFTLSLLCTVTFTVTDTNSSQTHLNYGSPPVRSQSTSQREASGPLNVELGANDRIRLPRQLVSGRDQGWRDLKDLQVDETSIQAKFTFSPTVGGSVSIDRMTGEVRARWGNILWGHNSLGGECRPSEVRSEPLF